MVDLPISGLALFGVVSVLYTEKKISKDTRDLLLQQFSTLDKVVVLQYDPETKTFKVKND